MDVLFLLYLCFIFDHQVAACPQGCNCDRKMLGYWPNYVTVWCNDSKLWTFPLLKTIPKTSNDLMFNNNNITDITLRDEDVIHLPQTIAVLDFSNNLLTRIPAYKKSILFAITRLWNLDLRNNRVHHIDDDAFKGLNGLMTLNLGNNRLSKVLASWFDTQSHLSSLLLYNNLISSFEPDNNFNWPDSLEDLYLYNNKITSMPPLPIKDCSKKASCWCGRTNVILEGNDIYSGCRRPEHNKTILNMTLPGISVYCDTNFFRMCPKFNANSFFQTYVEKPVCKKPRITVKYTNKGMDLFIVTGEPKPKVSFGIKLVPKNQKQVKATNTIEIRYKAENMFGKTGQTIYFDEETICQFNVITDNNDLQSNTFRSKQMFLNQTLSISCQRQNKTFSVANENENGSFSRPRESHSYWEHQNKSLPLWSMVTFCFPSFILALIILVFVIANNVRSDAIINEDE